MAVVTAKKILKIRQNKTKQKPIMKHEYGK
jgi:hypothetical protein